MVTLFKNLELEAAKIASRSPVMDAVAGKAVAEAKAKASAHVKSTAYLKSIQAKKVRTRLGVLDRVVFTDDPQAHIIEWGYMSKSGKWVPGQFIFTGLGRSI